MGFHLYSFTMLMNFFFRCYLSFQNLVSFFLIGVDCGMSVLMLGSNAVFSSDFELFSVTVSSLSLSLAVLELSRKLTVSWRGASARFLIISFINKSNFEK